MRDEVKQFIKFLSNLSVIKNDVKHNEIDQVCTLLKEAGYDFTYDEVFLIKKSI